MGVEDPGHEDVAAAEETTEAGDDVAPDEDLAEAPEDVATAEDAAEETAEPPVDDDENPEVTSELVAYAALQGIDTLPMTWTDNIGVAKVEVYVDGELACEADVETGEMDATAVEPGKHSLHVKVLDGAGNAVETEPVEVMMAGPGQFLPFADGFMMPIIPGWGSSQTTVFDFADSVEDAKGHVALPAGMTKVVAYLMWDEEAEWELGYDVGLGACPDHGTKLASQDLKAAQGWIELPYEDGLELASTTWFAHIRFLDGLEHKGDSVIYHALFLALP